MANVKKPVHKETASVKAKSAATRVTAPTEVKWRRLRLFWKWFLLPALIYGLIFYLAEPQYITHFRTGFFLDSGDGYQNVWNVWWVNRSLTQLHQSPYFTTLLHYPYGTSLIPQTMNIFNGLIAIPLMHIFGFNLFEAVNFAVVFGFVMSGVTMLWFIQKLYKKYWVSVIAGALFTFSSYHFAHAYGHLQLVSFEWIPLFLLAFWTLVEKPRYRHALAAAGALFLVLLCDYYYLFWSVMLGGLWVIWKLYKHELRLNKQTIKVFVLFGVASAVLVGPLVLALVRLNKHDPLQGFHDAGMFGLDPLTLIIPGGSWHWASLTRGYWQRLPYLSEMSVYFGVGTLTVLAIAFGRTVLSRIKRLRIPRIEGTPSSISFWWIILFLFAAIALGPRLNIAGHSRNLTMPYDLAQVVFPTLKISGMPVRWILISLIAAIVIVSYMLSRLDLNRNKTRWLLGIFLVVTAFDLYPSHLPLTQVPVPKYVAFIKTLPQGAVIDNAATSEAEQLRNQTIHEHPIAFGYVTRLPQSVANKDFEIFADIEQGRPDELCRDDHIRYIALVPGRTLKNSQNFNFKQVYRDERAVIYDLKNSNNCVIK